jgi:hypothetical protein
VHEADRDVRFSAERADLADEVRMSAVFFYADDNGIMIVIRGRHTQFLPMISITPGYCKVRTVAWGGVFRNLAGNQTEELRQITL